MPTVSIHHTGTGAGGDGAADTGAGGAGAVDGDSWDGGATGRAGEKVADYMSKAGANLKVCLCVCVHV